MKSRIMLYVTGITGSLLALYLGMFGRPENISQIGAILCMAMPTLAITGVLISRSRPLMAVRLLLWPVVVFTIAIKFEPLAYAVVILLWACAFFVIDCAEEAGTWHEL